MAPQPDIQRPAHDPYSLVGRSWPPESESAYHAAEANADALSTTAKTQAESADDAAEKTDSGMQGKTADSVSSAYKHHAAQLQQQGQSYASISGWMTDAVGAVRKAKRQISDLVSAGTQEIRDALDSELRGTPVTPSSSELTNKYRSEISSAANKLTTDLDSIGHSLSGTSGASTTPTYVRASSASSNPTVERAAVHQGITGESQAPQVTPKALPEMPRAVTAQSSESPSGAGAPSTPSAPAAPHPTLSNLISGGQGTPVPSTTSSPHASSPSTGTQAHQAPERHQDSKPPDLPRIPSLPLPNIPAAAAESIATVVSSAAGHPLPTAAPSTITPSIPASTGFTPGVAGTPPVTPVTPVTPGGLTPIGGGVGATPPAVQSTPQATAPPPTPQQTTAPSPTRGAVVDATWIQRTYGLAPGIEAPKSETAFVPAIFIADLPEDEAHLHRALGTLRQEFESTGWAQPLAVATIRKGFESKLVYVTSDDLSTHPHGVSLPHGVTPLDEMPNAPTHPDLSGSIMVSEKLKSLIPRGWEVQSMLSTVPADENSQTAEQYQELVQGGELLECKESRGHGDVEADEAMAVFARAAIGSAGCSELDTESSRLKAARWVGMQPVDYLGLLGRWYLADAADSMSEGRWGEAVYGAEKYLSVVDTKRQVA